MLWATTCCIFILSNSLIFSFLFWLFYIFFIVFFPRVIKFFYILIFIRNLWKYFTIISIKISMIILCSFLNSIFTLYRSWCILLWKYVCVNILANLWLLYTLLRTFNFLHPFIKSWVCDFSFHRMKIYLLMRLLSYNIFQCFFLSSLIYFYLWA